MDIISEKPIGARTVSGAARERTGPGGNEAAGKRAEPDLRPEEEPDERGGAGAGSPHAPVQAAGSAAEREAIRAASTESEAVRAAPTESEAIRETAAETAAEEAAADSAAGPAAEEAAAAAAADSAARAAGEDDAAGGEGASRAAGGEEAGSPPAAEANSGDPFATLDIADKKAVRRRILQMAGPSLVEMLLVNFVSMLNMIMVGRVGAEAVAAVGLTNQPYFLLLAVFMTLNVGTTALVARSIGKGDPGTANRAAGQAFLLNIALSIVIIFFSYRYAEEMLVMMGASAEVLTEGVSYARTMFLAIGFTAVSMSLSAILRGSGNTKAPMKINVLANILVVLIGFPLIYGMFGLPKLGVVGAGIASMASQFASMSGLLYVLFKGKSQVRLTGANILRLDVSLVKRILRIGLPAAGEQFAMRGGQIIFSKVVASLGTITFAANQIAFSVLGLTFMPGMAFSIVATTLVGQALGARKPELAEAFGWEIRKLGVIVAGSLGALFVVFAPYIMMPYTSDARIVSQGAIALRVVGLVQISQATQFILAGALRGAGDTRFPLYSTFVGVWGFRVLLSVMFVLWFGWGILGAWLAIAADQIIRSVIIVARYKSGKWKSIRV
ncbi:hypothetical protein J31TS4_36610 [Paenibacillus sp. J31TS4]|uniref:MATE family efflux transporter n=1 Tax=Paenibacillus sp. J31TS4 TaxID=2807195 RepID=UPI001B11375A|nr:MATE family efflux transporter [Paenibacillus sp. J31TS4]GIP40381.1 hypothetical protein J31TS4_36610 [Paenibacillus sp. J31TS4]